LDQIAQIYEVWPLGLKFLTNTILSAKTAVLPRQRRYHKGKWLGNAALSFLQAKMRTITLYLVATFAIAALSLPALAYPNSILAVQERCLDEVATRRPSREAVGATLELGLGVIASKYTERCPRVFGFDICGLLADVAITRIASSVTE
jgi:hypothetical protein